MTDSGQRVTTQFVVWWAWPNSRQWRETTVKHHTIDEARKAALRIERMGYRVSVLADGRRP